MLLRETLISNEATRDVLHLRHGVRCEQSELFVARSNIPFIHFHVFYTISKFPLVIFPHPFTCQQNILQTLLNRACGCFPIKVMGYSQPRVLHPIRVIITQHSHNSLGSSFLSSGGVLCYQYSLLMPFILLRSFCSE